MNFALRGTIDRYLLPVVVARMADGPVVLLEGPRTVGKSTLLRAVADAHKATVIDLDDLATRSAVSRDPALFVSGAEVVCIDEYQKAPLVLDAIKAELNRDTRPGRFVLAGSTRHDALPVAAQALTGRLSRLTVYPLSQAEIKAVPAGLVRGLFDQAGDVVAAVPMSQTSRDEYIQRVAAGGMPLALSASTPAARGQWVDDYVRTTLERDVRELSRLRHGRALADLLQRVAGQTAQVLNVERAAHAVGLDKTTTDSYLTLLEKVYLVHRLPAWGKTLTARSSATPKIHILDSAVASRMLRLTPAKLTRRDPSTLTEFGHVLESFVVAELLAQTSWLDDIVGVGHWRTRDNDEVDLVIERDDGDLIAIEVKGSSRVPGDDFRPLEKLRRAANRHFRAGIVLYLGERSYSYGDRLYAMPLDRLWTALTGQPDAR